MQKNIPCGMISSSQSKKESDKILLELQSGNPQMKLLYVTPERIQTQQFRSIMESLYKKSLIAYIAIDECHCVSQWGHEFRPDYKKLSSIRTDFPDIPICALTATSTYKVQKDVMDTLRLINPIMFKTSFNRANIKYVVRDADLLSNVEEDLVKFLSAHEGECGIIYCRTKVILESLVEKLNNFGIAARGYHASMPQKSRVESQNVWLSNQVKIIVATIAYGMGIDKEDVRFVVHYQLPKSMESFYQESGRAGRDQKPSVSLLYYCEAERRSISWLIENQTSSRTQEADSERFEKVVEYCKLDKGCRRKFILSYFGEETIKSNACNKTCDNCLGEEQNITIDPRILLRKQGQIERIDDDDSITRFNLGHVDTFFKASEKRRFEPISNCLTSSSTMNAKFSIIKPLQEPNKQKIEGRKRILQQKTEGKRQPKIRSIMNMMDRQYKVNEDPGEEIIEIGSDDDDDK